MRKVQRKRCPFPTEKIIFIYSRSPDSISSAGSAFPVPRWHFGTCIHHTVERAVPDSHRIPFSTPWHHYICYRFILSQGPHYIPIDNFHNLIAISYDYLLLCICCILSKTFINKNTLFNRFINQPRGDCHIIDCFHSTIRENTIR